MKTLAKRLRRLEDRLGRQMAARQGLNAKRVRFADAARLQVEQRLACLLGGTGGS